MRVAFAAVFCLPLVLTGCTLSPSTTETSPSAGLAIQGRVFGGNQPIVGAQVYLYAASTGAYGAQSTSLLTSATGNPPDINSHYYALTGAGGAFTITGDYSCTAGSQVYLYSVGGNPGLTPPTIDNTAATLMAVLGNCPGGTSAFASTTPYVVINEVSTVAAAYAFAGFATDPLHVSSSPTGVTGLQNAFANAANLANLGTGVALATTTSGGTAPQATVNSLADILASCVNTNGTITGGGTPTPCYTLFTNALSGGTSGSQPGDTATAAINIAHNPGANVGNLYGLVTAQTAFTPTLGTTAPNDFTLGIQFTGGGVNAPNALAIDGSGNVWITNNGTSTVTELANSGAPATGSPFSAGGMDGLVGIAIDLNSPGNAWIANDLTASTGSVIELSSTGTLVSPSPFTGGGIGSPNGIAIDGLGDVWVTNSNNNTVSELLSSGSAHANSPYSGGGLNAPAAIAIDASGDAWIANTGTNTVSELTSTGAPTSGVGYAGGGSPYSGSLNSPTGIAIDHSGDAWVPNAGGQSVAEFLSTGSTPSGSPFTGNLNNPEGVAIDGSGNLWIANLLGGSVSEVSSAGVNLSGANGFGSNGGIDLPDAVAIDSSGNVWVANIVGGTASAGSITELVGAATPVATPLAAGVKNGKLGAKP